MDGEEIISTAMTLLTADIMDMEDIILTDIAHLDIVITVMGTPGVMVTVTETVGTTDGIPHGTTDG